MIVNSLPISPLEGEMPVRAEGGAASQQIQAHQFAHTIVTPLCHFVTSPLKGGDWNLRLNQVIYMAHFEVAKHTRTNAKSMRRKMTRAELKLWNELRAHRLMGLSFRRQLPIGKYIVDFACPKYKLIIEVDGSGHGEEQQRQHDSRRTSFIESKGWKVIRFWNDDVLKNIDDVCTSIIATLREMGTNFND